MRAITGKYKGRHFDVPHSFKARPTTDFAKENLFNVLNNYLDFEDNATALDLFAGTGSISLELLSRGCTRVISVEKDPLHFKFITKLFQSLNDRAACPVRSDVFRFVERCNEQFDLVFADPPYALKELGLLPDLVLNKRLLKADGIFVLEHGKTQDFSSHPGFFAHRSYGSVNFSFFRATEPECE
ncbi:MAG: RsmD family RNA methyltransferase [Clostridium sp.]|nr:RsmD family RNA methyltransferase [Clostridium sp.]